ncbi:hypothetical protein [Polaribacter sp. IC063]|uniref:hypothetical protein n=1 Tax=Polaribacter sp. IC063 TaxID=57031 RepID=UPI0011BF73BD|nr:hypothetical protein [Polaribacter sp. IC063]TXD53655.1 hypothetical protein ES043_03255 [Polaribacter sp. IC063]
MKNIIELNAELEKISKPEIYFQQDHQTFANHDTWVIEADVKYFSNWYKRITDKIDDIADLDSPRKVKFIKLFHQDVLQKYEDATRFNHENLEELKSTFSGQYSTPDSMKKPIKPCSELLHYGIEDWGNPNFLKFHNIIQLLGSIFYSEDYLVMEDPDFSLYEEKYQLEELLLEKIEMGELSIAEFESDAEKIEMLYSYVELSFYFENIKILLKNIAKYLDTYVNLIKKLENFQEDKLTLEEVFDNDPNNLKLEFSLNKMDVAFFYKTLFDAKIINLAKNGQKKKYTNLIKYIDSSNMYYIYNNKLDKIKNINKEFTKCQKVVQYKSQEMNLLELIISKFTKRKEELLAYKEEGEL